MIGGELWKNTFLNIMPMTFPKLYSEYLSESMKLKNFSARTNSFGKGENWYMIVVANKNYDSELFKLNLENINTAAEYTGEHCRRGYWKYDNLAVFKWLFSIGSKINREKAYETFIKNKRRKHRVYFKLNFNDVSAILSKYLLEMIGLKDFTYNIKMYGEGYDYKMLIVISEKDDLSLKTINMDKAFENIKYNGTHVI